MAEKLKYHTDTSIQSLYSVLGSSTFDRDWSLESSWIWHNKFSTPGFVSFFCAGPFKFCQIGWGPSVESRSQVRSEMFNWVQVRALAGPLKDIHIVVPKPLPCFLGCVLLVIELLEGEPSALCEVSQPWPVPQSLLPKNTHAAWCCHHHASPLEWYWAGYKRLPQDMTLRIEAK